MSYYEIALGLETRIGAGGVREIVDRCKSDPSIRVCIPEPNGDRVVFRFRCGIAELTDSGLKALAGDDTAQRGAWSEVFPTASRTLSMIQEIPAKKVLRAIPAGLAEGWFRLDLRTCHVETIDREAIEPIIGGLDEPGFLIRPLVRPGGSRDQVAEVLAQLRNQGGLVGPPLSA